jgi:transketolase
MLSMRQTTAAKLLEYAKKDAGVLALTADLSGSVGFDPIMKELPSQFLQCGIAEQQMMSTAAALALQGFKPFAASYSQFHPGRNWDQLRTSVCYNLAPVRLISSHYGLSVGGDGATHQNLEYLSLTLCLPNLDIFLPFNNASASWALTQMYNQNTQASILFQPRESHSPEVDTVDTTNLDKLGFVHISNNHQTLVISGGLIASQAYATVGADHLFLVHLTKLDTAKLSSILAPYSNIIIVEEHTKHGGLGSIIFDILATNSRHITNPGHPEATTRHPELVSGSKTVTHLYTDGFGRSALTAKELWHHYKIDTQEIQKYIK